MNYNVLRNFVFIALLGCSPVSGMSKLLDLSIEEAANLWRGGALTIIRRIEIKHDHKFACWVYANLRRFEFDVTGNYLRLNCEKNFKYNVIYEIASQEEVKNIRFIPCYEYHGIDNLFDMEKGALMKRDHDRFDYEERLICEVFRKFEKHVVFGCFQQSYKFQQSSNPNIQGKETDIGAYDFRYDSLLFRLPINRTQDRLLAVNHNGSMIATNLDDCKDTIVILYPQLFTFLNYKNYYDFNIIYK